MDIPTKKEERNLECAVCLDILSDPRILTSCGHTLCSECISLISQKDENKYSVICPYCSQNTYYEDNIDNLNKNYSLSSIIEEFNSRKISRSLPAENYLMNKDLKYKTHSKSLPDLQIHNNNYQIISVTPYIAEPVENEINMVEHEKSENESINSIFSGFFSNLLRSCNVKRFNK